MKRFITTAIASAVLIFGGASAANAAGYPVEEPDVTVEDSVVAPGEPTTITVYDLDPALGSVTFTVTGGPAGATLASLVYTAASSPSVTKPVTAEGTASAQFTAGTPGNYAITVTADGEIVGTVQITVAGEGAGAGAGTGEDDGLAATGSEVPAGALWAGIGAVGLGGAVLAGAAIRRRKAVN